MPSLLRIIDAVRPLIGMMTSFIEKHPKLAVVAVAAGTAIAGLGVALVGLSLVLPGLVILGGAMSAAWLPVIAVVLAIAAAVAAGIIIWKNWEFQKVI